MKMKIRKATKKDEERVVELFREYDKYENKLDKRHKVSSKQESKEFFNKLIKSKISIFLVLEADSKIEGVISGEHRNTLMGRNCIIHELIISKNYRGKGAGKRLMKEFENQAKKKGCKSVQSFVLIGNKKVLNFYKKLKYSYDEEGFVIRKKLK